MASAASTSGPRRMLLWVGALSVVLWMVPGLNIAAYPVRMFVTVLHETGHAVAAVVSGGTVLGIAVDSAGNGVTTSSGGIIGLILPAGYIGAVMFGAGFLLLARRAGGRAALWTMTGIVAVDGALWIRGLFSLVVVIGLIALLALMARWLRPTAAGFAAVFLSLQLCFSALSDLRDLLWLATDYSVPTDAVQMSRLSALPAVFWAVLWAALGTIVFIRALRSYVGRVRPAN